MPFQRRDKDEVRTGLDALGALWTAGAPVAWDAVFEGTGARRTGLPGYPFEHRRYWLDAPGTASAGLRTSAQAAAADVAGDGEPHEDRPGAWADRLAGLGAADRERLLLDLVRGEAATVLGHATPDAVAPDAAMRDLGFDSLAAVTLRTSLAVATGLPLPETLAFEHPTPSAIAAYLSDQLTLAPPPPAGIGADLGRIRKAALTADDGERDRITGLLRQLTAELSGGSSVAVALADADDEDVFAFIDNELGIGNEEHYV